MGKTIDIIIDSVNVTTQTAATVTFTVKVDGVAADIKTTPLTSLRFTFAGPATDYGADAVGGVPFNWYNNSGGYNQSPALGGTAGAALLTATATAGQFRGPARQRDEPQRLHDGRRRRGLHPRDRHLRGRPLLHEGVVADSDRDAVRPGRRPARPPPAAT